MKEEPAILEPLWVRAERAISSEVIVSYCKDFVLDSEQPVNWWDNGQEILEATGCENPILSDPETRKSVCEAVDKWLTDIKNIY